MLFEKRVEVGESVLVRVYADGRHLGVLAFTKEQWSMVEAHGSAEIFVATESR